MDIKELIEKYEISLYGEDKIQARNGVLVKKNGAEGIIREKKPEIMAYLKNEEETKKRAAQERKNKINAIEGLAKIQNAIEEQKKWWSEFDRAMNSEDGRVRMKEKPKDNIAELKQKYPRAAAYLLAEAESLKSNYELSAIGKKALEAIINGDDYKEVMNKMETEQKEFVNRHIWD